MISNCGSDENGKYHGGKAGDNNAKEWTVKSWYRYSKGWNFVARHPKIEVGEKISDYAKKAAENENVGYDQYERTTFWNRLQESNYDPSKIKTPCEADCSSGIAAIVKAVGFSINDSKMKNVDVNMWTGSAKSVLKNAGFTILTESKYLTSDAYLMPGDIIVNEKSHMVTNLDYGKNVAPKRTTEAKPQNEIPSKKSIDEIVKEVIAGKWGNGTERRKKLEAAGYNYTEVQNAVNKALSSSTSSKSTKYKVNVKSTLRVRSCPNGTILKLLTPGTIVNVVEISNGWAKLEDGTYVSADYIVKA